MKSIERYYKYCHRDTQNFAQCQGEQITYAAPYSEKTRQWEKSEVPQQNLCTEQNKIKLLKLQSELKEKTQTVQTPAYSVLSGSAVKTPGDCDTDSSLAHHSRSPLSCTDSLYFLIKFSLCRVNFCFVLFSQYYPTFLVQYPLYLTSAQHNEM